MVKDKVNINIPAFNLKLSYVIPIVLVLFLGFTTLKQWSSTRGLRNQNKALKDTNKELLIDYTGIKKQRKSDSLLIVKKQIIVDSLISIDNKRLRQLYNVNRKYEKLKIDFDSANPDDKWIIFTNKINN